MIQMFVWLVMSCLFKIMVGFVVTSIPVKRILILHRMNVS